MELWFHFIICLFLVLFRNGGSFPTHSCISSVLEQIFMIILLLLRLPIIIDLVLQYFLFTSIGLFLCIHYSFLLQQVNNYSMVSFIPLDLRKERRYTPLSFYCLSSYPCCLVIFLTELILLAYKGYGFALVGCSSYIEL